MLKEERRKECIETTSTVLCCIEFYSILHYCTGLHCIVLHCSTASLLEHSSTCIHVSVHVCAQAAVFYYKSKKQV